MEPSQSPPDAPAWEFRTIEHAQRPRQPTEYIIDRFLATHTVNIVYGAPGSLKSMVVLDMALSVAAGGCWLPGAAGEGQGFDVIASPIVWIDMDNGRRRTDERVDAMSKGKKIPIGAPFYYVSMPSPTLVANDVESMGRLLDAANTFGARVIVIDNLGLVTGTVEENSAEMAQVMKNFRWLSEETGAALVILHHQRKGGAAGSRAGDALRGHSSIEGALDLALHVVRESNTNEITIISTKTRGVEVPRVVTRFIYEHVPGTNDLSEAYFTVMARPISDNSLAKSIEFIISGHPDGIVKSKLIQLVYADLRQQVSFAKIRAEVENMLHVTGELRLTEGKQNAKIITAKFRI